MALKAMPSRLVALPSRLPSPDKRAEPFYLSPAWRKLIAQIKRERGNRCEVCGAGEGRIIGDHIIELKDGGAPLDKANVRLLCMAHHNSKTASERRRRSAEVI